MSIQCEQCGGTLQVRGYEQELGDPRSRLWTLACPVCGQVHQYDSSWVRVRGASKAAAGAFGEQALALPVKAESGLNTPALAW